MMKRRMKPRVYYLPSVTYGIQQTASSSSVAMAPGNSAVLATELIMNGGDQPQDVQGQSVATQWGRMGPTVETDLIIRSISGQIYWCFNGKPAAAAAPTGIAGIAVRQVIFSTIGLAEEGQVAAPEMNQSGLGAMHLVWPDIGSSAQLWNTGSRNLAGVTVFWSKTFYANIDFGTGQTQLNSASFDSPATRVHTKSAKRLRWNQRLWLATQYSVSNLNSLTGNGQITHAPSLQIAVRRARTRRF